MVLTTTVSQSATTTDVLSGGGADPKYYLRVVLRRKWFILLVFCVVLGGVSLYTVRQSPVYAAQVRLIIDPKDPRFLASQIQDVNSDSASNYWANKEYLETQYKIIRAGPSPAGGGSWAWRPTMSF